MRGGVQSSSDGYIHHKEIKLAQVSLAIVAGTMREGCMDAMSPAKWSSSLWIRRWAFKMTWRYLKIKYFL